MNQWQGLAEFVAVAETGSFTVAAGRLAVSVAQVSRQVSGLEDRLGAKLFYRTTRKVVMTENGGVYYQHCRSLMDGLAEAERAILDLQATPRGKIKMTAPITYGEESVMPLVNDFVLQYPQLELHCQLSNQLDDLVTQGYDLAIRIGTLSDSAMMAKKLASRTPYVCAAPSYLNRYGIAHSLAELEQHNCLVGGSDIWRFQEAGKSRNIRVSGNIHCNSGHALVDAALKGVGLIQLPDYYVQAHLDEGSLISLLDHFREPEEGIWALFPHSRNLSPKIKLLVEFLAAGLGPASNIA
ncbi:MAG: LysR substrate-binding domain-containing protein [Zhongshania sp.]|uniref:LysR substrate-binding domain-containing protein n=1 Tax=Zhongshania sp. TaxID=1971902 RepID=UPI00262DF7FD|nr:LysR substrate-binding domain-containing protein [Zhongshania sp.]MDF1693146.1 LysR substrate-binding domain-containing protein [Zhongshania sp.]